MSGLLALNDYTYFLTAARGPLASLHSLDIMWVSFYSIASMIVAVLLVSASRKWIKIDILAVFVRLFAFLLFIFGSVLMVLVIFTWPS